MGFLVVICVCFFCVGGDSPSNSDLTPECLLDFKCVGVC